MLEHGLNFLLEHDRAHHYPKPIRPYELVDNNLSSWSHN